MLRVLSVFGTRPEAIKMAPLLRELERRGSFLSLVCVTAQHRALLDQVLAGFSIMPDHDLDLMTRSQSLSSFCAAALQGLEGVLRAAAPDLVLVHGDTVTALAGALAAYHARVPLGHVEAGLRSGDKACPFPEEMNRRLVDALADLHFAPTALNRENLLREGLDARRIFVTGNTVVDALALTVQEDFRHPALDWALEGRRWALLTTHRRESWGAPLRAVFRAVRRAAERFDDLRILCSVHPNPAVRTDALALLSGCENLRLLEPPDVFIFHNLLARADLVLTDSGGIQEEAAALNVPTLVLRERSERPEGVEAGILRLVGTEEARVFEELCRVMTDEAALSGMRALSSPYGDGHASERIADALEAFGGSLP